MKYHKIEYSLNEKAEKLLHIFDLMNQWGAENLVRNEREM
jgi:DNA-binding HxlR family transcriptional regulator